MKAVVYHRINDIRLDETPEPKIESPNDALIRVTLSSICASDIHIKALGLQQPGKILGHEYCGKIEEVGKEVHYLRKGDRVIGKPFSHCGHCFYCQHQQPELCEKVAIFGSQGEQGVQAEYARIPWAENTLKKIPDVLSDEDILFTGDILSTGLTPLLRGHLGYGETVAIFGSGPVGLCAVACAKLFGASQIIAVDILDYRLHVARKFGAITINASKDNPIAKIKELTEGRGADLGIEAAGVESTFNVCLQSTRRGGRMSIVGMFVKPTYFNIADRFLDIFHLSIGLGDCNHIEELIALIKSGNLDLKPLITHRLSLSDALKGYEIFEKKLENCIKVVLKP
jgi:alcohol dehydrogenase